MKKFTISLILFFLFFAVGLLTLKDYGISWDGPVHYQRGQVYLWYIFTGQKDYKKLPSYNLVKAQNNSKYHERSLYQIEDILRAGKYIMDYDRGHPPVADIISAFFNFVLYQRFGIVGDIESYHIFIIFCGALAVVFVFLFASEIFGNLAGILSAIFMATYPLFWSESHFNIKDPPVTAFITASFYFFWKGIKKNRLLFISISSVFAGLALGVKFNILFFAPLYLWFAIGSIKKNKKLLIGFLLFPLIIYGLFYVFWPYIWGDPIARTIQVFKYYEKVGIGYLYQGNFLFGPFNLYPLYWILTTTPLITLITAFAGLFTIYVKRKKNMDFLVFILFWLALSVGRVSFAKMSIYGGVRQIMEFVPAVSILAGTGSAFLINNLALRFKKKIPVRLLCLVLVSIILIVPLWKLHPYENIYFNSLIGNLGGAIEKKIPAAGNTFGMAYKEGIDWINSNAPQNSKLAIIQGAMANLPLYKIRSDIIYDNRNFSGIDKKGEYLMEVNYIQEINSYHYVWEYSQKFLKPVYEVKVDGGVILTIWKNDQDNTKEEYKLNEVGNVNRVSILDNKNYVLLSFDIELLLSRLSMSFKNCDKSPNGYIEISTDGTIWERQGDPIPSEQIYRKLNVRDGLLEYMFPAVRAKYIKLVLSELDSCSIDKFNLKITYLK